VLLLFFNVICRADDLPSLARLPRDVIKMIVGLVADYSDPKDAKYWWRAARPNDVVKCQACGVLGAKNMIQCALCRASFHVRCVRGSLTQEQSDDLAPYCCFNCANRKESKRSPF
jgi:hypothetical protein